VIGDAGAMFDARREDWRRHVVDLQDRAYEGATDRAEKELVFERAFALTTPVAEQVLRALDAAYLGGRGTVAAQPPARVSPEELLGAGRQPMGGLLGAWQLTWPRLEQARNRLDGRALPAVEIFAMFPSDFTHPHLALCDLSRPRRWVACWPFQVSSAADAERQETVLAVIAEADMHERTFVGDLNWRLLDVAKTSATTGFRDAE
jgi:hypothetical protein